ncbi:unnamed protein product, partial [Amoebophrya sp. A25]|eukprot:GSA25T00022636001.1
MKNATASAITNFDITLKNTNRARYPEERWVRGMLSETHAGEQSRPCRQRRPKKTRTDRISRELVARPVALADCLNRERRKKIIEGSASSEDFYPTT